MTQQEEVEAKLQRVRQLLSSERLDAVVLTQTVNFQWLTAGADNHVVIDTGRGVAPVVITTTGQHILTSNVEAGRLEDEEIGDLPFEIHQMNWHEEDPDVMLADIIQGRVASDGPWPEDAEVMADQLARLRWRLLQPEIERYGRLGRIAAAALGETAREIEPGMTEHEIGARLAAKLIAQNVIVSVLLIAVDERISKYRHPIPTGKHLDRQAMLVVGARKGGLDISATRLVHFGQLPAELADKHQAVCQVDATFIGETRPGAAVRDIFAKGVAAYQAAGYPDEWKLIGMLPETPSGKVLGAGFGRMDEEFLQGMDAELHELAGDARQLIETARIKSAAFALYSEDTLSRLPEFDEDFLVNMGLSGLAITKAGYPSFIISFMFSRAASGAGLEKVDIEGGDAYYKAFQEDLRLMLKNKGSIFFVTLAADRDSAQKLMESVLQD